MRDSTSTAVLFAEINYPFRQGIFLDIFPLDEIPPHLQKLQQLIGQTEARSWRMRYYKHTPFSPNPIKQAVYQLRSLVSRYTIGKHGGFLAYYREFEHLFREKRGHAFAYSCLSSFTCEYFPKDLFDETIYLDFEGRKVPVPAGYDTYLRILYGENYMQPVKAPSLHGGMYIDPDHSYREVLPRIRRAQSLGQRLLRLLTGKKEPQWLQELREL